MTPRRHWTAAEDRTISRDDLSTAEMAAALGRSIHAVRCRRQRLGIHFTPGRRTAPIEEAVLMGDPPQAIAARLRVPVTAVYRARHRLRKQGAFSTARKCRCGVSFESTGSHYCSDACRRIARRERAACDADAPRRRREYYAANREAILTQKREYGARNATLINECAAEWRRRVNGGLAPSRPGRFSQAEDAVVMRADITTLEKCAMLERSYDSVLKRQSRLRKCNA